MQLWNDGSCRFHSSQTPRGPQPRKRFYKQVGVTEVNPPWENLVDHFQKNNDKNDDKNENNTNAAAAAAAATSSTVSTTTTVDNPISAGVDGTQSASGINTSLLPTSLSRTEQMQLLKERLIPHYNNNCNNNSNSNSAVTTTTATTQQQQWYSVTLDGRILRTPIGQILSVPSDVLAWMIAAEWDAQHTVLRPVQMPLMTLVCTTLDQTTMHMDHYRTTALKFLPTDTTCFWADPLEDRVLHRHQQDAWTELHDFIYKQFQYKPAIAMGTQEGMLLSRRRHSNNTTTTNNNNNNKNETTESQQQPQGGLPHPPQLYQAAKDWTYSLDAWTLTALNAVASETKSFLLAYAVLHPSSPFSSLSGLHASTTTTISSTNTSSSASSTPATVAATVDKKKMADAANKAIRAARVEEEFQIEAWGLVEGQHDYDRLNCSIQVRSSKLLAKCILEHSSLT